MFIRVKQTPNSPRKSVQIVENYRKDGQVKQKIIRYVGIAMDAAEEQKLKDLAADIIAKMLHERAENSVQIDLFEHNINDYKEQVTNKLGRPKTKKIEDIIPPDAVTLDMIEEQDRIIEGVHEVAGKVYEELNYGNIFTSKKLAKILKDLVLSRLVYPYSKHKLKRILSTDFDIQHDLDAIYRLMDHVHGKIDTIKQLTFAKTKSLFPQKTDVVLFDVTTLYFESTEQALSNMK